MCAICYHIHSPLNYPLRLYYHLQIQNKTISDLDLLLSSTSKGNKTTPVEK